MSVSANVSSTYLFVVAVWSTTPLMIQWSSETMTPIESITLRVLISLVIAVVIMFAMGIRRLETGKNWKLYLASGFGICPAMPLVYLGSSYIPSGLVSVLFGLAPFFVGILSAVVLHDKTMTRGRYFSLLVAISGLAFILIDGEALDHNAHIGIGLLLASTIVFSVSSVFVKRYAEDVHPLQQLTGSLLVASIGLLLFWALFDGKLPGEFTSRSLSALIYLAVVGSVLAFIGYFYLIQRISVNLVTLIPLITPAVAIWLGYMFNGEKLTLGLLVGSGLIISGLGLFNWFKPVVVDAG